MLILLIAGSSNSVSNENDEINFDGQQDAVNLQNAMGIRLSTMKRVVKRGEFSVSCSCTLLPHYLISYLISFVTL